MTRKLLVADDSITIQTVVGLAFAEEDVTIVAVGRGDEALRKAREVKPDIVLADVFMPGLNGYEVCEGIKADPELSRIPVVLMVGTFESFDSDEAKRVRADAHLTKPFDTGELLQTVRSLTLQRHGNSEQGPMPTRQPEDPGTNGEIEARPLVTERSRESFMGTSAILDVFGPLNFGEPSRKGVIPQEVLRSIVEDVVRRLSPDIVREVAWEVVPELSEMLVRRKINGAGSEGTPLP